MVTLAQAARALAHLPNLLLSQVLALVYLSMHVKKKILLLYPSIHPPEATPPDLLLETRTFLARSCSLTDRDVEACWDTVQDLVWQEDEIIGRVKNGSAVDSTFFAHGGVLYREFLFFCQRIDSEML